ncbi:unnamed protein product [Sympodiomycopsis kandeliae]
MISLPFDEMDLLFFQFHLSSIYSKMPRKTRAAQKAQEDEVAQAESQAAPQEPAKDDGESSSASTSQAPPPQVAAELPQSPSQASSPKGKGREMVAEDDSAVPDQSATDTSPAPEKAKMTMEERKERMAALRKKMHQSTNANRKDLSLDKQPVRTNRKDGTTSRKLAKAEAILDERDAKERGEDWERIRNWKYSIEDEERWQEMKSRKEESQDQGMTDPNAQGARSYARVIRNFKPDLNAYKQSTSSNNSIQGSPGEGQLTRRSDIQPAAVDLAYGSHKPNDNAIDKVISHLNMETDNREKRSRKRPVEEGGDITYINEKNAAYNRKINRHFDEYTQEIRDNFERGTAL